MPSRGLRQVGGDMPVRVGLAEVLSEIGTALAQAATTEPMSPDGAIGVADKIVALHARVVKMEEDDWGTPG